MGHPGTSRYAEEIRSVETLVVAAVDGSVGSLAALEMAVDEAAMRGCPVRIAHARDRGPQTGRTPQGVVEEAAAYARECSPQVPIETCYGHGRPGPYLTGLGAEATVLVLGSRGFGGFTGLLAGSVSLYVAERS